MAGMHRAYAAVLLAILTLGSAAPVICSGWEPLPSDRMACCQRAAHERCDNQSVADSCCAGQEQTHQPGTTIAATVSAGALLTPAVVTPGFEPGATQSLAARHFQLSLAHCFHSPPGLPGPPLRI